MKLHLFIILAYFCAACVDGQRTRSQNVAESDTSTARVRGRARFSLPIDVDAELADIPSKAIRPQRLEPRIEPRVEARPVAVVRKAKFTTPKTSLYEVEEIVEDIPDKNFRKVHKSRVITETRFEAANAPKKPLFEAFPRPEDEITPEIFTPQILKSTTEKVEKKVEEKNDKLEKNVKPERNFEEKEIKRGSSKEEITEDKTTLSDENITSNKAIEENISSQSPESTTSSEVSSTENEVKSTSVNQDKTSRTTRTRVTTSQTTPIDETTSRIRSRGRRPTQIDSETTQRSRTRSRGEAEITKQEPETPSRSSRFRTTRRKVDSSEKIDTSESSREISRESSRIIPRGKTTENSRTRTGRKVNYPTSDNIPGQSENTVYTIKPRTQNSVKSDEHQKVSRGRSRAQRNNPEVIETTTKNSRRNQRRKETNPSRKFESTPPPTSSTTSKTPSTTSTISTTSIISTTLKERNSRRNQKLRLRSETVSSTTINPRGRTKNDSQEKPNDRKISRQRSRFIPPIIDEQKLEVLPLFESEAKTVEPIIKKVNVELKSKSSNEIASVIKPQIKEKIEIVTSKPLVKETVETKISEVVSTRRVVRPVMRKRKKSKGNKNETKNISRGEKKAELEKSLNADDVDDSDNYPEAFKALLHAKSKEGSRTRSSEATSTKKVTNEKVVTVPRLTGTSFTSTTKPDIVSSTHKVNDEDNNIIPSTIPSTTRGTRRKFSLATKPPNSENPKRPISNGRKIKIPRSTVAPSQVSIVTEVSQSIQTQPRYHARFVASSTDASNLIDENISTTPKVKPSRLYSSRKGSGKKKERKDNQQLPSLGKKKNRYSARYRNDIINRPASTKTTNAPVYIPTVPTVTPSYVKQRIEDGMEIISIDEPVNTIPSDNLINGELLTPSNIPEKLLPASLVTTGAPPVQPSEKQPVSIIERIIYSITAISSTVAPNQTTDKTDDGPTKETSIFKIPSKKDQTKQTTDKTNESLTATTEKPTTIIERILSSLNAIQSTSSPTAVKNELPSTQQAVEMTQAPIAMNTEINKAGEFDDIPKNNVTENVTNNTAGSNERDTEEVNIEENTISTGNQKPEKIIEAVKPEITTKKIEVPKDQIKETTTVLPTTMIVTPVPIKKIPAKTIPPEFNFVENDIQETTTQRSPMTTVRYTNTPTTVSPAFEDYQLNIKATTPYFIQRILANFTSVGSRIGLETTTGGMTEIATNPPVNKIQTTIPPTNPPATKPTIPQTNPPTTSPTINPTSPTVNPTVPTTNPTTRPTTRPTTTPTTTTTTTQPTTTPTTTIPPTSKTTTTPATTTRPTTTNPPTTTKRFVTTTMFVPETTFFTTTRRIRTASPTTTERRTTRPTTEPPTTTVWQTTRRRGGRFRTTTPEEFIRTVTVTPSTQTTELPQTEEPTRRTTFNFNTVQMFARNERPTVYPIYTTPKEEETTMFTGTSRLITREPITRIPITRAPTTRAPTTRAPTTRAPTTRAPTTRAPTTRAPITNPPRTNPPTTLPRTIPSRTNPPTTPPTTIPPTTPTTTRAPSTPPVTLSAEDELRRLAELRVLENFGELSTTNDFVTTSTMSPITLPSTLKIGNKKIKELTEQQKKDLQELARLEKEQAEILRQLSFLTRLNFGGAAQKPTRSPSNLASRVLEFATDRDKTTTENPLDLLSTLTKAGEPNRIPPGTKDVSLDDLLRQFNVNPERVTPSNLVSAYGESTDAILAALLKEQGIGPSTPKTLGEQLKTTIPIQIPTERPTKKVTTPRKRVTTTTPRPGPIMQGLNWLLNVLAPPTTTRRPAKKRVTTTERITTIDENEVFSSQPTEINPVVVTAPKRSPPNPTSRVSRKYKRPLHALSENELSSLISQLEEAQKDPRKAQNLDLSAFDLSQTTQKATTNFLRNNAVQITNSGKVGSSSKLQAASTVDSEVVYRRKPTTPLPSTVSNSISDEDEEYVDPVTKPPRRPTLRPVVLNPVPGIDDGEGETRVRGQLLSAAVNVTRAISQFLGSAIQDAAYRLTRVFSDGSTISQYVNASSIIPDIPTNSTSQN